LRQAIRQRTGDDRGIATLMVGILLVAFLVIAALCVDVGSAWQQNRQASSSADAGALASAQALGETTFTPSGCGDVRCVGGYYALASADRQPSSVGAMSSSACTMTSPKVGETCGEYRYKGARADVTWPYVGTGAAAADKSLVHVKICWNTNTSFARVIGRNRFDICGEATAQNTGTGGAATWQSVADCYAVDNFADANEKPSIYVFNPGDYPAEGSAIDFSKGDAAPKQSQVLSVLFQGLDSPIDVNSIAFNAPTTVSGPTGKSVTLPRIIPTDDKGPESAQAKGIGYTVQDVDSAGLVQPFTADNPTNLWLISYQLPDDAHLKVNGKSYTFSATLHAADVDGQPGHCGNASWKFTHDGKNINTNNGGCGENSFLALGQFPSNHQASPGQMVGAYYSDESPLQERDVADAYWSTVPLNAGIDFEISGPGFTDANGNAFQIPPSSTTTGGYVIGPLPSGVTTREKYNNTIEWQLPAKDDPRWVNGATYTLYMRSYDTDQNKPGNDCGVATWSFVLSGAVGRIHLVD
jgi:hypothetical protein